MRKFLSSLITPDFFKHYIEIAMATVSILIILISNMDLSNFSLWTITPICFILIYLSRHNKIAYICSGFVMVVAMAVLYYLGYSVDKILQNPKYWAICLIATICFLSDGFSKKDEIFIQNVVTKLINSASALAISILLVVITTILIASIEYLFSIKFLSGDMVYEKVSFIAFFGLFPLLFLLLEEQDKILILDKLLQSILNFILSPALLIYTLILYAYIIKISLISGLPKGGVAIMVSIYLLFGIALSGLQLISYNKKWQKFYKYFTLLAIAPIALLWVGIYERVNTYGLTIDRIYLIAASFTITITYILMMIKSIFRYRHLAIIAILSIVVTFFIINPTQISLNSQVKRLFNELQAFNLLDENGKIILTPDELKTEKYIKIYELARYIKRIKEDFILENNEDFLERISSYGYISQTDKIIYHGFYRFELVDKTVDIDGYKKMTFINQYFEFDREVNEQKPKSDSTTIMQARLVEKVSDINLDYNKLQTRINENIQRVFNENGLDIKEQYSLETLSKIPNEILNIKIEDKKILLDNLNMKFYPNLGWRVTDATMFIMLEKE